MAVPYKTPPTNCTLERTGRERKDGGAKTDLVGESPENLFQR